MTWTNGNTKHVTTTTRNRILKRDGNQCQQCGNTEHLEVDHINNRRGPGYDHDNNLQVLCHQCHKAKTQRESGEWRQKTRRTPRKPIGLHQKTL